MCLQRPLYYITAGPYKQARGHFIKTNLLCFEIKIAPLWVDLTPSGGGRGRGKGKGRGRGGKGGVGGGAAADGVGGGGEAAVRVEG